MTSWTSRTVNYKMDVSVQTDMSPGFGTRVELIRYDIYCIFFVPYLIMLFEFVHNSGIVLSFLQSRKEERGAEEN